MADRTAPPNRREAFQMFEHERPRSERTRDLANILIEHGFNPDADGVPVLAAITRWADAHASAGLDAIFGAEGSGHD
jgi:hypothetical protein